MMWLLEIMNITYNMEFIIFKNSKCYLQRHFETYPIISNITTHCLKTHYKYLRKPKIFANNKSPWGMKTHGNMYCWCPFCRMNTAQPKGTSPHEQAQSKKTPTRGRGLKIDNQLLFILDQSTAEGLHKRTKSLWMD